MTPQCLTVLAPIRPGREAALRETLRAIGDDINGSRRGGASPDIAFRHSARIHFARFAILTDPDRGSERTRLLYASAYDGTLESHLDELVSITSGIDAIWGACDGYTGVHRFPEFIAAHAQEPAAYYVAFRDETAASIAQAIAARRRSQAVQDAGNGREPASCDAADHSVVHRLAGIARRAVRAARRVVRAAPLIADVVRAIARYGFANVYDGATRITASLDRYVVFRVLNRITGNRVPPLRSPFSSLALDQRGPIEPLAPGDEIPVSISVAPSFREDAIAQNQLTLVTVIAPGSADRVRAVMSAIDSYARRLAPPGSLIGISSIHFVRWLVIDNGRRLLFISDYDGSWESYIDEFAEMILTGLDAIWETSFGMPPDGARDLPAFKRFLRSHQVPSDLFFAAYPGETVLNVAADRALVVRHPHGATP